MCGFSSAASISVQKTCLLLRFKSVVEFFAKPLEPWQCPRSISFLLLFPHLIHLYSPPRYLHRSVLCFLPIQLESAIVKVQSSALLIVLCTSNYVSIVPKMSITSLLSVPRPRLVRDPPLFPRLAASPTFSKFGCDTSPLCHVQSTLDDLDFISHNLTTSGILLLSALHSLLWYSLCFSILSSSKHLQLVLSAKFMP